MDNFERIKTLIKGGADYLYANQNCHEDNLPHGRRAYVWTLQNWLYKHGRSEEWRRKAKVVEDDLYPTVRKNPSGDTIIFPGLYHRRNYSTNAIDCGVFVDSFFDFAELCAGDTRLLESKVYDVSNDYILKKLASRKDVHDQYLWAATGLARFLHSNEKSAKAPIYREALEDVLDFWVRHHEKSGYSPYMESDPFMGGLTPYYFSRRIAFSWYILEKAKLHRPDIEKKLVQSTRFFATLFRPDGVKEMRLEAKRYYFSGPYEAASHPFDIYIFSKAHMYTNDELWLDLASVSLRRLMEVQAKDGGIRSRRDEDGGIRDWQCDTMRTGHLAWLTRVSDDFLIKISNRNPASVRTQYSFKLADVSDRVLLIGNEHNWIHFVTRKGKIAGHAGERLSGIIAGQKNRINRLWDPCLFHYHTRGNLFSFLRNNKRGIITSFKYASLHAWDSLYYKKSLSMSFAFIRDGLIGYLYTGIFIRSTEFATETTELTVGENLIGHALTLSDLSGTEKEKIGLRKIQLTNKDEITITDTITTTNRVYLFLPGHVTNIKGPRVVETRYNLLPVTGNANPEKGL